MFHFARSAVRAYPSSFIGSFLIILVASALLAANGALMETGLRQSEPLLTSVAGSFAGTAILVVVLVVASTFGSALRQRAAQFALLRAVGATPSQVRAMVTAEVAIVFGLAAPLGAIPGLFAASILMPLFSSSGVVPTDLVLSVSPLPVLAVLIVLFPTALLAARLAARQITRVSATAAVSGSSVESARLSRGRAITAITAIVFFALGIVSASVPFFEPGTIGSATGATSALLLITAVALGGPAIVGAVARRAACVTSNSRFASAMLAAVNSRGFSRRLTAAIIPLALLLALGTVQTGVNATVAEASGMQLRDGLGSDVVITSSQGVTAAQLASVASTPGVDAVVGSSMLAAEVRVDNEDVGELSWEQTSVRSLTGSPAGLIDADVTSGSLDDLTGPGTIAVSSDAFMGVGDTAQLRFGSTSYEASVVAVYSRGLGFGDFIVLSSSLPASVQPTSSDLLLAQGSGTFPGLSVSSVDDYVDATVAGAAAQQQLGAILLFVLIFFVAIAAANTLVMLTRARSAEFALLRRIGATRRQLSAMIGIEAGFVMVMALAIGTLAVLPALTGVAYGLLGGPSVGIDWPVYAGLSAAVVAIAGVAMVGAARVGGRGWV